MTPLIWTARSAGPVRAALLPAALVYRAAADLRRRAYVAGLRRIYRPAVPTICIGNLSVGGTGKTPLAQWAARWCLRRGLRPAVVLRGYGHDEESLHRSALPHAIVVADPDRQRGARRAIDAGAETLILDDGFQRFDVARDLDIALVSADASDAVRWPFPAGPWREPWTALGRAGVVIVTRKSASDEDVAQTVQRAERVSSGGRVAVARLGLSTLRGLRTGRRVAPEALAGRRVLAIAGVGDPRGFGRQLRALGAEVALAARPDHYRYPGADVRRLGRAAAQVDYVVLTGKDAVKLRINWPVTAPEPLVAELRVTWERGRAAVEAALARACTPPATNGRRVGGGRGTG